MNNSITIGFDAKRIVRNNTGLGSYGRTLVRDLAYLPDSLRLRLYAPDKGRDDLRSQVEGLPRISFCYPKAGVLPFEKALWRDAGIVRDLKKDKVQIYHGLSGELPRGIRKSGIKSVVTIHDLIFLRHLDRCEDLCVEVPSDHQGGRPYHRHQRVYQTGCAGVGTGRSRAGECGVSELCAQVYEGAYACGGRTGETEIWPAQTVYPECRDD